MKCADSSREALDSWYICSWLKSEEVIKTIFNSPNKIVKHRITSVYIGCWTSNSMNACMGAIL
ncbi:hypothetical protein QTP88_007419 [Uroleucon formosanum]